MQGHDQPESEMRQPIEYVDGVAASHEGVANEKTINAAQDANNVGQGPSNQGPDHHYETPSLLSSSGAGGLQQSHGTAASGQNLPSHSMNIKDLHMRGMALYSRLKSGETLTAAESREFGMIKNVLQRATDQSKKDQTAQNSSLHVGQPKQANSLVFQAPPQHVQNPEMRMAAFRMRFAHLQDKQISHGLTALENQELGALGVLLRRMYSGSQQENSHTGEIHAFPSPSRAGSSQYQAAIPGSTALANRPCTPQHISENQQDPHRYLNPPRSHSSSNNPQNAADPQLQLLSIAQDYRDLSSSQTTGQRPQAQNFNIRYNSTQGYNSNQTVGHPAQQPQQAGPVGPQHQGEARQQSYGSMQGQFSPRQPQLQDMSYPGHMPPRNQAMAQTSVFQADIMQPVGLAGQKHVLYGNESVQNRAKRARVDAPLDAKYLAGQMQPTLKQTPNPGSDNTRLQEQPMITLPLGNLDPKVAQETLRKVIQVMQSGGTLLPVLPGMKGIIVPQHSIIFCRPQKGPSVFIGSSDTPDIQLSQKKIATPSFLRGLEASQEHQRKMDDGVPHENIKVAVFDDRQNQLEPVSKPMQSSSISAKSGESNDETTVAGDQEAIASNEDTQVDRPTLEDAATMPTAQEQSPGATAGIKRPLSAVREEPGSVEDSNHAAKKAATAAFDDAADNSPQAVQAKSTQVESTSVLSSPSQRALHSRAASPKGQPSIPWVPTSEGMYTSEYFIFFCMVFRGLNHISQENRSSRDMSQLNRYPTPLIE